MNVISPECISKGNVMVFEVLYATFEEIQLMICFVIFLDSQKCKQREVSECLLINTVKPL